MLLEGNHVKKVISVRLKNKNPMVSWTKVTENTPDECHRRLVPGYLQTKWGPFEFVHLQTEEKKATKVEKKPTRDE